MNLRALGLGLTLWLAAGAALAVNPNEMLADPTQEHRAREVGKDLRCLVCQNQSIDDSDAELAKDLRIIVRERITAGDSDDQIRRFVVERYGDYVLLKPPFKGATLVLWVGPFVFFALGLAAWLAFFRRREGKTATQPPPLSEDEKRRLAKLLEDKP